tara:strand:- start:1789 stop:2442 length:654 start_codon:yes stop_codon:yes gene_type:complete
VGAIPQSEIAVGEVEDPGVFAMKPVGGVRAERNDFLNIGRAQILDCIGVNAINTPDAGSGLLVAGEAIGIAGVFLGGDKELNAFVAEMECDALDGDDVHATVSEIGFAEREDFFEVSVYISGAKDGEFEASLAGTDTGAGITEIAIAPCNEDGAIAVLDDIAAAEPITRAAILRFDQSASGFLIDEFAGKLSELLLLVVCEHGFQGEVVWIELAGAF